MVIVQHEFIADHPVLDFLATIAERGTTDCEYLQEPGDLADWVEQSGLIDGRPAVGRDQLADAIVLREALYRALSAVVDGGACPAADRARVNAAASAPLPVLQLTPHGAVERRGDLGAVLAALARDGLDLLGGADRALLRRCADARCTRLFVDRSRGRRRRWCDMKGCGDRAKAAAYRQRRRTAAG
jgi:predicted RNA-binding Zn ribbon-like protein